MGRSRVPSNGPGGFFVAQFSADCATNMSGLDFRQAQGVTAHPTAEWISRQLTGAYGWNVAPQSIIRDRDAVYGDVFISRLSPTCAVGGGILLFFWILLGPT
jgi:hypothetical protein